MNSLPDLRVTALAAIALLSACDTSDSHDHDTDVADATDTDISAADADLDGVTEADGDCDDHNNRVYPGADERSGDGIDSDCDGEDAPALGEDLYEPALALMDTDHDDAISLAEFSAACAVSSKVTTTANPGVVETHVTCGGTGSCRGMHLHPWNQLFEHSCKGVNGCAGWSCVETPDDSGKDAETLFHDATCDFCHTGDDGKFLVQVPEGADPTEAVAAFQARTDDQFLATIAFGHRGQSADGVAFSNMPAFHESVARAEMERLIAWIRTRDLQPSTDHAE